MNAGPKKAVHTRHFRQQRFVEGANATDDDAGTQRLRCRSYSDDIDIPLAIRLAPPGLRYNCFKTNMLPDISVAGYHLKILMDLAASCEEAGPFIGFERKRIKVARNVAGGTGIAVLEPDAPEMFAALYNNVWNAGRLERHGRADPGYASADDQSMKSSRNGMR